MQKVGNRFTRSGKRVCLQTTLTLAAVSAALASAVTHAVTNPTVEQLRQLSSSWDANLYVALEGGKKRVELGDTLRYHLNASENGLCYLVHVDTQGAASLMRPSDCSAVATNGSYFPSKGNLEAAEPEGKETVFAIMVQEPSPAAETLLQGSPGYASVDDKALGQLLNDLRTASTNGQLDIAENSYLVGSEKLAMAMTDDSDLQFTTRGIIRKVMEDTQSSEDLGEVVKEISFDVQSINFEFGSEELTEKGVRQLNEFGAALQSSELADLKLRIAGHTDDQGESAYNLDLSQRRASSVARYLKDNFQIEAERLDIIGMGEAAPLVPDTSLEARAQNRRVEMIFVNE